MGPDLNDDTCLVPLLGSVAVLVLDVDAVPRLERREGPRAMCHSLLSPGPGFGEGLLSGFGSKSPLLSGEEFARLEWERVSDLATEDCHSWADPCVSRRCVSVYEDCLDNIVCVQGASLGCVASDQFLCMFHGQLCSLVCLWVVSC